MVVLWYTPYTSLSQISELGKALSPNVSCNCSRRGLSEDDFRTVQYRVMILEGVVPTGGSVDSSKM